jgi:hypothetical protein
VVEAVVLVLILQVQQEIMVVQVAVVAIQMYPAQVEREHQVKELMVVLVK